jgi:hypothetical protein
MASQVQYWRFFWTVVGNWEAALGFFMSDPYPEHQIEAKRFRPKGLAFVDQSSNQDENAGFNLEYGYIMNQEMLKEMTLQKQPAIVMFSRRGLAKTSEDDFDAYFEAYENVVELVKEKMNGKNEEYGTCFAMMTSKLADADTGKHDHKGVFDVMDVQIYDPAGFAALAKEPFKSAVDACKNLYRGVHADGDACIEGYAIVPDLMRTTFTEETQKFGAKFDLYSWENVELDFKTQKPDLALKEGFNVLQSTE